MDNLSPSRDTSTPDVDRLKRAIWLATLPFQRELIDTGGVTFMGLRNAVADAVLAALRPDPSPETEESPDGDPA